jgi:hypothetical protein
MAKQLDPKKIEDKLRQMSAGEVLSDLGRLFYTGAIEARDFERARKYYQAAADRYSPDGRFYLADMYYRGVGGEQNKDAALALLKTNVICNQDSAPAIVSESIRYLKEQIHIQPKLIQYSRGNEPKYEEALRQMGGSEESIRYAILKVECNLEENDVCSTIEFLYEDNILDITGRIYLAENFECEHSASEL